MKAEATAARTAAQEAASTAGAAAQADLAARVTAGEFKGDKGADGSNVLPTDTAIKQAIEAPASATRAALSATYAPASGSANYAASTVNGKAVVRKHELVINVKDYGALGDGATDDSTAVLSAIAAIPAKGGKVYFPPTQSYYKMTQPLPNRSNITYYADGRGASRIRWTSGSMLVPTTGLSNLVFRDIYIDSASNAPLIDRGSTGGCSIACSTRS